MPKILKADRKFLVQLTYCKTKTLLFLQAYYGNVSGSAWLPGMLSSPGNSGVVPPQPLESIRHCSVSHQEGGVGSSEPTENYQGAAFIIPSMTDIFSLTNYAATDERKMVAEQTGEATLDKFFLSPLWACGSGLIGE